MIKKFKRNNIYRMKIDFIGHGIEDILFRVYDVNNVPGSKAEVLGKYALAYNIDRMVEDVYYYANHVVLNDILFFYLGFELSAPHSGINEEFSFVKYEVVDGLPMMIELAQENDGSFSHIILNEEKGRYEKERRIEFLDELQDLAREYYKTEFPIDLEKMNHAYLREPLIPELAKYVTEKLEDGTCTFFGYIKSLLIKEKGLLDYDADTVLKYGLAHGLYKLRTNMYGLIIEKA